MDMFNSKVLVITRLDSLQYPSIPFRSWSCSTHPPGIPVGSNRTVIVAQLNPGPSPDSRVRTFPRPEAGAERVFNSIAGRIYGDSSPIHIPYANLWCWYI